MSSGLRINSAKDDAAGLNISDRLTAQINGLNQGSRNANDGIALAQTIEGGLDEITNMLQRMRTLAVQSANGINTSDDRTAIQNEVTQLSAEIERIAKQTTYGGKTILYGVNKGTTMSSIYSETENTTTDAVNATGSVTLQVGANSGDTINLTVASFAFTTLAFRANTTYGTTAANGNSGLIVAEGTVKTIQMKDGAEAQNAIKLLDDMLQQVDSQRSALGSIQNRLEATIRVQSNVATNESDARSRIRDTDFAEESANLSQQSIIQQAATSMLMQANSRPQIGLSLLG